MDGKLGVALLVALVITVVVMVTGFSYLQNEINSLKPQTSNLQPTVSQTYPPSTPNQSPTSTTGATSTQQTLPYTYVVYEWDLKPAYVNNVTWLNQSMGQISYCGYYYTAKTWKENYFVYLSSHIAYPEQAKDDPLVWYLLGHTVYVSAAFDEATGHTVATYQYVEYQGVTMLYGIENFLPSMAVNGQWTKNFT